MTHGQGHDLPAVPIGFNDLKVPSSTERDETLQILELLRQQLLTML